MYICPRCGSSLSTVKESSVEVDLCSSCGGVWLDRGELAEITQDMLESADSQQQKSRDPQSTQANRTREAAAASGEMHCPKCSDTQLNAFIYSFDSGIELDRCNRCEGVWLDGSELEQVVAYVKRNKAHELTDEEIALSKSMASDSRIYNFLVKVGRLLMKNGYRYRPDWHL